MAFTQKSSPELLLQLRGTRINNRGYIEFCLLRRTETSNHWKVMSMSRKRSTKYPTNCDGTRSILITQSTGFIRSNASQKLATPL